MRAQRSRGAYIINLARLSENGGAVPRKGAQTHFPDGQNDVALQHKRNRLCHGVGARIRFRGSTPKTRNLQGWGDLIGAQLPIQLQNGCVSRSPRTEHLIVYRRHAFRREPVFPSID